MLKKLLAVTITCLLIGLGIASSAVDTVEDTYDFDVKEIITPSKCNKKFYAVDSMQWILEGICLFGSTQKIQTTSMTSV